MDDVVPSAQYVGTQAVVRQDPKNAAHAWKKNLGRKMKKTDRLGWYEYARRNNMTAQDIEAGWDSVQERSVEDDLQLVFGEGLPWGGYYTPTIQGMKMQPSTGPASYLSPNSPAMAPDPAFPFHTKTADKVWEKLKKLSLKRKDLDTNQLLALAIEQSDVSPNELTPEDAKLLGMAIEWLRNGPAGIKVRSEPSGPFAKSTGITGRGGSTKS